MSIPGEQFILKYQTSKICISINWTFIKLNKVEDIKVALVALIPSVCISPYVTCHWNTEGDTKLRIDFL